MIKPVNKNIALLKPAWQIDDTVWGGVASNGVDGNTNADWFNGGSCTHTNADTSDAVNNNWWVVDLQSRYSVEKVILYNRADCCGKNRVLIPKRLPKYQ